MRQTSNLHVESFTPLEPPDAFLARFPLTEGMSELVASSREQIHRIITGQDDRILILVGPCSIHDEKAGLEYARRLAELAKAVQDQVLIVMRVYFEKPRTTIGWKGFINDPNLNGSFDMVNGLIRARKFLLHVLEIGLPVGTEWLDPVTPQYLADVMSWGAIGARTVESQTHRQLASGLSMPIGFKNGTGGTDHSIQIAVDAIVATRAPHTFLSVDGYGRVSIVKTTGNPDAHVVLRGGVKGPNYSSEHIADAVERLKKAGLPQYLMVDCSHGNSNKDHRNQPFVFYNVLRQRFDGNRNIVAVMVESHLFEGSQSPNGDPSKLKYGVSITDACVGWETTQELIAEAAALLRISKAYV
ncbi:MAG: 3-deoxy-7-phosphoheptulonate synthase [bacterium]|nr:3-deoxy-7-phosphoheptulonate synthase [bacterium]